MNIFYLNAFVNKTNEIIHESISTRLQTNTKHFIGNASKTTCNARDFQFKVEDYKVIWSMLTASKELVCTAKRLQNDIDFVHA